jgi:hypothetical protein
MELHRRRREQEHPADAVAEGFEELITVVGTRLRVFRSSRPKALKVRQRPEDRVGVDTDLGRRLAFECRLRRWSRFAARLLRLQRG